MPEKAPVLELSGVCKAFGGARALSGVDFTLAPGEVHAVVGMNGAGKSTLVETMAGAIVPDSGAIVIAGRRHAALTPRRAHASGVSILHQKRTLVPGLSIAENLLLGRLPTRLGAVGWRRAHRTAAAALTGLGIDLPTERIAASLGPAEQTLVEIAREVHLGGRVLILDEPTASLGGADALRIHRLVRTLRSRGTGVVYISHDLDEVLDLADRITVMRDGRRVVTVPAADLDPPALIRAMVGDRLKDDSADHADRRPDRPGDAAAPVLELAGLTTRRLHGFDLTVRAGETTAVLGPAGDGQSELFPLLSGFRGPSAGRIRVNGAAVRPGDPGASLAAGLRCVTGDRLGYGLVPGLSVDENLDLVRRGLRRPWLVRWDRMRRDGRAARRRYGITAVQANPPVAALSGGNQQKVLLAAWLDAELHDAELHGGALTACLLEEPTNGVDVAAKADIHRLVGALAAAGTAVLLASSDVDEVVRLADRVVVVRAGRTVADLPIDQVTRDDLVALTAGGLTS